MLHIDALVHISLKEDAQFYAFIGQLKDARVMDEYTKRIVFLAQALVQSQADKLTMDRTGVVISTGTGPYRSILDTKHRMQKNGFRGINPSLFPNVMSSTALAYACIHLQCHGPVAVFFQDGDATDAQEFCAVQLALKAADAMLLIQIDDGAQADGYLYMRKDTI